jgi:serine/threonine protein kinase
MPVGLGYRTPPGAAVMAIKSIGKFTVLNTLGAGANSSILHVRRADDGKDYALKVITLDGDADKKYLAQAEHELRVGRMLDHPHLVKVYCLELERNWLRQVKKARLLVEYVPGETLDKARLLKHAKLLRVLAKAADGLVHMHKRGVYHADLKPNNVMLGRGTNTKVIDYGLAWVKGEPKERVQGTPEYMAPETAQHKLVNERTDIFNLGATMYRLATFKLPPSVFPELEGVDVTEKDYKAKFVPVRDHNPGCPPGFAALIEQCLSFNAHKRPERMSVVQGELDRLADEELAKLPADEREECE